MRSCNDYCECSNVKAVEEKYGKKDNLSAGEDGSGSSESESEDDDGALITEDLDAEILATVSAIRAKDPKVYDERTKFYSEIGLKEPTGDEVMKQKPMYLRDYHRENLLGHHIERDQDVHVSPPTYAEEQANLKDSILQGIRRAGSHDEANQPDSDEDDFLVQKQHTHNLNGFRKDNETLTSDLNVEEADKDPEDFLNKFMISRAWTTQPRNLQPFESDEEEEDRADAFEEAYNLRFEDPERANEKLISHSREIAAKYSVRRSEPSSRQKTRSLQKQKREVERKNRERERHRLRNLKIEEMQEKIKKIKESAGLRGEDIFLDEWKEVLEADWDDAKWDAEMRKRFDKSYYADDDCDRIDRSDSKKGKGRRQKVKKPKWEEDISIEGITSEAAYEDSTALSAEDENVEVRKEDEDTAGKQSKKERAAVRSEAKRTARLQRRFLEDIADASLETDPLLSSKFDTVRVRRPGRFRYRETSPTSFGLSAFEILMAEDSQLNQHVGLKKLTAFRDPEKKKKDKEKLNKKSRLRKWRLETFGTKEELNPETSLPTSRAQNQPGRERVINQLDQSTNNQSEAGIETKTRRKKKKKRPQ